MTKLTEDEKIDTRGKERHHAASVSASAILLRRLACSRISGND